MADTVTMLRGDDSKSSYRRKPVSIRVREVPQHPKIAASPARHRQRVTVRITLDLEDDLLAAAKELVHREGTTAKKVISRLVRALLTRTPASQPTAGSVVGVVAGFVPFPAKPDVVVTDEQAHALRDAEI